MNTDDIINWYRSGRQQRPLPREVVEWWDAWRHFTQYFIPLTDIDPLKERHILIDFKRLPIGQLGSTRYLQQHDLIPMIVDGNDRASEVCLEALDSDGSLLQRGRWIFEGTAWVYFLHPDSRKQMREHIDAGSTGILHGGGGPLMSFEVKELAPAFFE